MFACALGSKEMAELLVQYKANIHATNNMKETCMSFAQKSKNQDLIMFLVSKGISIRPASGRSIRPPSTGNRSQATIDKQPVTGNQSQATSHRQPITGSQPQATSRKEPITGNH